MRFGIISIITWLARLEGPGWRLCSGWLAPVPPCLFSCRVRKQHPQDLLQFVFPFLDNVFCLYCCSMLFCIKRYKTNFEIQTKVPFTEATKIYSL